MPIPAAAIRREIRRLRRRAREVETEATAEAMAEFGRGFHSGAAFALGQAADGLAALLAEADLDEDEAREPAAVYAWEQREPGGTASLAAITLRPGAERHHVRISLASLARLRRWAEAHGWEIEQWTDEDPHTGTDADGWTARPPR
ncbi:MAG: hypothetical protein M5U01_10035 [Ardenticatenaceae bacterium]|nr:hypothetical protein [Ardenticatenaceae bacterium]